MLTWLNNVFSKNNNTKNETNSKSQPIKQETVVEIEEPIAKKNSSGVTEPLSEKVTKQPLSVLKKLAPIRDLKDDEIDRIEQHLLVYKQNSTLFKLGEKSQKIFYLLKGSVELQSDGGASYLVHEDTPMANLPLNSGKVCGATAITKSQNTIILTIPTKMVLWWTNKSRQQSNGLEVVDINLPAEIPDTDFFNSFAQAYRENKLSLPSLPQVAVKLRKAMEQDSIDVADVIKIVQVDAPIVAKLVQVSNSVLYAPTFPIKNCHDAVTRLGLETTRKLVLGISVKQLFKTNSPKLMAKMQELWKKSLHVSSLCFVLAQESAGDVEPEDALLAGLICDIGAIPLIHFAEKHPENYPDLSELQAVMPHLNPPVGSLVLHTLGFPDEITEIPRYAENWYYESGSDSLTLIDIVILAKLHSYLGTERAKELPYINSIPAYAKLKNGKMNPDFSLDLLVKAQKRIDTAMGMFA